MCRDIDDNHITILVPTGIDDNMNFGVRVITFDDDELIEYDEALKKFKAMFKKYFEFIFDGTVDEAANWIGENTRRGRGNHIVDNKYLIYTTTFTDNTIFDTPFYVVRKNGKYLVGCAEFHDSFVDTSDYGVMLK
jgi:hypothetical protein